MLEVNLSGSISDAADGATTVSIEAATIRELLKKLVERYPKLASKIEEGVAVSINGDIYRDVREVKIPEGAEIFLLPRIQGG
jgi:molybdopterin synthase sulfur carrier subunit